MKRTNIYLPDQQLGLLRRVGETRGKPVAELVREAVDSWLTEQGVRPIEQDEWQERFDALLSRREGVAKRRRTSEERVMSDVSAAIRETRRSRTARRR